MIERFQRCRGLRLPLWGGRQLELWYCPRGESIPMHHHERCHGRLIFLAGRMRWQGGRRSVEFRGRDIGRSLRVAAGEAHGATVTGRFGIFLNYEIWTHQRTSAALDFVAH